MASDLEVLPIKLPHSLVTCLKDEAQRRQMGVSTLVRELVTVAASGTVLTPKLRIGESVVSIADLKTTELVFEGEDGKIAPAPDEETSTLDFGEEAAKAG
ncbi:MAG: hypothetical protein CL878_07970 [Dehalococcoidia bacterium]|nr:hypothetical protein [Dehalococcoidia bacterium]